MEPKGWHNASGDKEWVVGKLSESGRGRQLADVAEELKADPEVVLTAMKDDPSAAEFAAPALLADRAFALDALAVAAQRGFMEHVVEALAEEVRADREVALIAVSHTAAALQHVPHRDKEFILAALRSPILRAAEIVFSLIDVSACADADIAAAAGLPYAAAYLPRPELLEYVATGTDSDGNIVLRNMPEDLRADREVVAAAIAGRWDNLECAAPPLQADRELVLAAIRQSPRYEDCTGDDYVDCQRSGFFSSVWHGWDASGGALAFAAPALQGDEEVVREALARTRGAFPLASPALRARRDLVLFAIEQGPFFRGRRAGDPPGVLHAVPPTLLEDRALVLAAVARDGQELGAVADRWGRDRDVVLTAVRDYGRAFLFAAEELRADPALAVAALDTGDGPRGCGTAMANWNDQGPTRAILGALAPALLKRLGGSGVHHTKLEEKLRALAG